MPEGWAFVVPASAGIVPARGVSMSYQHRRPRQRGDRPYYGDHPDYAGESSPPARGSSTRSTSRCLLIAVVPASAGIVPDRSGRRLRERRRPRQRGDRPSTSWGSGIEQQSSPPARGSSAGAALDRDPRAVVPASAGIVQPMLPTQTRTSCRPRQRGDRPVIDLIEALDPASSPPARGSSGEHHEYRPHRHLVPASAGIVPCCYPSGE